MQKKRFAFILSALLTISIPALAGVTVEDPLMDIPNQSKGGARTGIPSVNASAMGDELTIDINRYLGNAQVTVMAQDGLL